MRGNQRLSLEQLQKWEALGYGMFIHFGMSTFDGEEFSKGYQPSSFYSPDELEVDQWVRVAKDAGMKYAVLTTKHVSGHCLWPSKYTDYHVGTSGNPTDVVGEFVKACHKYGIMPGFYYCSWDNHHLFGSLTPSMTKWNEAFTTEEYLQFQSNQIGELLTLYYPIGREWFYKEGDVPRSDEELLGMYLVSRSRSTNLLLDVGPDKRGKISELMVDALMRLKTNIVKVRGEV